MEEIKVGEVTTISSKYTNLNGSGPHPYDVLISPVFSYLYILELTVLIYKLSQVKGKYNSAHSK